MTTPDHLTRPHPLGVYGAGGQAPTIHQPEAPGASVELLEGDAAAEESSPVRGAGRFESEPVRLLLRPVLVALLGLLTVYGITTDHTSPAWLALVDALVAVGGWVYIERVRASVYSPRGAERKAERAARAAAAAGRDAWASTVATETSAYRLGPL